jgi:hypothetical protein
MPLYSAGRSDFGVKAKRRKVINLYTDRLLGAGNSGNSFESLQWSGGATTPTSPITYGAGDVTILTGATGRFGLCHFDCRRENYPTYSESSTYNVGDIVYGGKYGHGLYKKTASSIAGFAPVYTSATTAQDANGWTRYRPTIRTIKEGETLKIHFTIKLDRTGYVTTSSNAMRIGVFKSTGAYLNASTASLSDAIFNGYSGYMFGTGPANVRILKRTTTSSESLINNSAVYTELAQDGLVGFGSQNQYDVAIYLNKLATGGLRTAFTITGAGLSGATTIQYTDTASPYLDFDTLVFYTAANQVASIALSAPYAAYIGENQAIPTGIGSDNPANAAQADATASLLIDGPFYNTEGNSASGWIGGQSWRTMAVTTTINGRPSYYYGAELVSWTGSQWQYQGSRVFSTSSSNVAYPWLATAWTNNYSVAKVIPGYAKPSMYPGVP